MVCTDTCSRSVPDAALTAVLDPDASQAGRVADESARRSGGPRPAVVSSLAELLERDDVDAVAVCTPSGRHAEVAVPALRSGRHVLVEKPVEVTVAAAAPIRAAALAAPPGTVVSVVSQHRFDPASVAVHDDVRAGRLGRLGSAVATVPWWRADAYYTSGSWRGTLALDGGGALENQGIHTVDLLLWLLGEPVEVLARTGRLAHPSIEVEDTVGALLTFASGAIATVHATTAARPGLTVRLSVHGDGGSAVLDNDRLDYLYSVDRDPDAAAVSGLRGVGGAVDQAADVVPPGESGRVRGGGPGTDAMLVGHTRQYDDVLEAIRTGRPPGVGLDDGLRALATVRAVYAAAASGAAVRLADVLGPDLADALLPGGAEPPATGGRP